MRLCKRIMASAAACALSLTMLTACGGGGGGSISSRAYGGSGQPDSSSSQSADSSSSSSSSSSQSAATTVSIASYNNSKAVKLAKSLSRGTGSVGFEIDGNITAVINNGKKAFVMTYSEDYSSGYGFLVDSTGTYKVFAVEDGEYLLQLDSGIAVFSDETTYTIAECAGMIENMVTVPDRDIVLSIESGNYTYDDVIYDSETFTVEEDEEIYTAIYCFKDGELEYFIDPSDGYVIEYICCSSTIGAEDREALDTISKYTKMTEEEYNEYLASQE